VLNELIGRTDSDDDDPDEMYYEVANQRMDDEWGTKILATKIAVVEK
jgi:hypothetical protein